MTNTYKSTDCGALGKTIEKAIKEYLGLKVCVAKQGRTDMRKGGICYEIKTGAAELGNEGGKLLKGCSTVIYIPVIFEDEPIERQEGFVLSRKTFLEVLEGCGLIREKTATDGSRKIAVQTFWNRSKNAPTSKKKYFELLDALYENCDSTFSDWLAEW